jgi:hypothetical protein
MSEFFTSYAINLYDLNLLIFTDIGLGSKLVNVTNNIVLLNNTYCILYSLNHFLVNFPRYDLLPIGNHITKSLNLNHVFVFFYWLLKALFHYLVLNFTLDYSLSSCGFLNLKFFLLKLSNDFLLCGYYLLLAKCIMYTLKDVTHEQAPIWYISYSYLTLLFL